MAQWNISPLTAPPKVIVNYCSDGSLAPVYTYISNSAKTYNTALDAGVLTEILAVSGAGVVDLALVYKTDVTERAITLKVVIDGVTAFNATSAADTTANNALIAVGIYSRTDGTLNGGGINPQPMVFNSSLSISIKSSIGEVSGKLVTNISYRTI